MSESTNTPPPKWIPDADGRNVDFHRHAASGRLHIQHCGGCGRAHHPPRYLCAGCGSEDLAFVPSEGRGRLFSWTVTHRVVDPGWAAEAPWATVVVEMEEGIRLVGGWRGALSELALEVPVQVEVEPATPDFAFLYFRPLASGAGEG